ncbi:hypothetical protein LB543_05165 [Mesorhizobium sp. ESP7-2]|uniref:hypothetical protein n=1 Tax=Mesorhizobium sp. ESP7-2 TaxID=2876622 RepID=UPI001CCE003E|nr:hypothetical protein [Mesorhizobium sp. ESP7-2]MBZ9706109.1 hypothetical protein [Mesorhizobium sp. ESP7-2]
MSIFGKILGNAAERETRLGMPARDGNEMLARAQRMYLMTGGRGFRVHATEPRVYPDGKTRGERKRAARAAAVAKEFAAQETKAAGLMMRGLSEADAYSRFGALS